MGSQSAKAWALERLQSGEALDHPRAILSGHGWRLAARIHDLRKEGHQIMTVRGRGGVGQYFMPDGRQRDLFGGDDPAATGSDTNSGKTTCGGDHGKS